MHLHSKLYEEHDKIALVNALCLLIKQLPLVYFSPHSSNFFWNWVASQAAVGLINFCVLAIDPVVDYKN